MIDTTTFTNDIEQIKEKQYTDCLKDYSGDVLLVGINYDKESKRHSCKIERAKKIRLLIMKKILLAIA